MRALDAFRFLLIAVSVWMNHRQLQVIEYFREENRVLIAQNLTDSEDRILTGKRYLIHDRDPNVHR